MNTRRQKRQGVVANRRILRVYSFNSLFEYRHYNRFNQDKPRREDLNGEYVEEGSFGGSLAIW